MDLRHYNKQVYEMTFKVLQKFLKPEQLWESPWLDSCLVNSRISGAYEVSRVLILRDIIEQALAILEKEDAQRAEVLRLRFIQAFQLDEVAINTATYEGDLQTKIKQIERIQKNGVERLTQILVENERDCIAGLEEDCERRVVDLAGARPSVSLALGGYFVNLLEREDAYVPIADQIEYHVVGRAALFPPLGYFLHRYREPRGPRIIALMAAGGMGKTTIAVQLIKCLLNEGDVDRILGDSAKVMVLDEDTGRQHQIAPGFVDPFTFYSKLHRQLDLPPLRLSENSEEQQIASLQRDLKAKLKRSRVVIVVDNLDELSVQDSLSLLDTLLPLLSRDVRAIITTRRGNLRHPDVLAVMLNPLRSVSSMKEFLGWYTSYYAWLLQSEQIYADANKEKLEKLIKVSGGIPLVAQLLYNQIAEHGWAYLDQELPNPQDLLTYLYERLWTELSEYGQVGLMAQELALQVAQEQQLGKKIDFEQLINLYPDEKANFTESFRLLEERFLLFRNNETSDNYVMFPSFVDYLALLD